MRIIEAIVSFPLFSVRLPEAFQVAESNLLPPPSTICGAFAYSYANWCGIKFEEALSRMVKDSWYFAIPLSNITYSSIILRRNRLLDKISVALFKSPKERDKILEKFPQDVRAIVISYMQRTRRKGMYVKEFLDALHTSHNEYYWRWYENKIFDAMYRRYVSSVKMYIAGIVNVEEFFPLNFSRLGDTESYVSIVSCSVIENDEIGIQELSSGTVETNTYAPLTYRDNTFSLPIDRCVIQKMAEPEFLLDRRSRRYLFSAMLPLRQTIREAQGRSIMVFEPVDLIRIELRRRAKIITYNSRILGREIKVIVPSEAMR